MLNYTESKVLPVWKTSSQCVLKFKSVTIKLHVCYLKVWVVWVWGGCLFVLVCVFVWWCFSCVGGFF